MGIGLANALVPSDTLHDEAVSLARTIARRDPADIRLAKRAIQRAVESTSYAAAGY